MILEWEDGKCASRELKNTCRRIKLMFFMPPWPVIDRTPALDSSVIYRIHQHSVMIPKMIDGVMIMRCSWVEKLVEWKKRRGGGDLTLVSMFVLVEVIWRAEAVRRWWFWCVESDCFSWCRWWWRFESRDNAFNTFLAGNKYMFFAIFFNRYTLKDIILSSLWTSHIQNFLIELSFQWMELVEKRYNLKTMVQYPCVWLSEDRGGKIGCRVVIYSLVNI